MPFGRVSKYSYQMFLFAVFSSVLLHWRALVNQLFLVARASAQSWFDIAHTKLEREVFWAGPVN